MGFDPGVEASSQRAEWLVHGSLAHQIRREPGVVSTDCRFDQSLCQYVALGVTAAETMCDGSDRAVRALREILPESGHLNADLKAYPGSVCHAACPGERFGQSLGVLDQTGLRFSV